MNGYEGLYIVDTTASSRPVQIMRRKSHYVRHSQTSIAPYHRYKGLSSLLKNQGIRRYLDTSRVTNPICLICGYEGLDIKV